MKKLNPAFLKAMAAKVNESPYYVHTSMEIKEIDRGYCLMQLAVREKHLQPYGMVLRDLDIKTDFDLPPRFLE